MKNRNKIDNIAISFTNWVGSIQSLIVHTILFVGCFVLVFLGVNLDEVLLILTTVVSLEAIYLAIFIQMSVNRTAQSLEEVEEDIDEIQGDVDEIQKDVDEIQEDVDEIQKDVDEIQEDVDEIQQEDSEEDKERASLDAIQEHLKKLINEVENLRK